MNCYRRFRIRAPMQQRLICPLNYLKSRSNAQGVYNQDHKHFLHLHPVPGFPSLTHPMHSNPLLSCVNFIYFTPLEITTATRVNCLPSPRSNPAYPSLPSRVPFFTLMQVIHFPLKLPNIINSSQTPKEKYINMYTIKNLKMNTQSPMT